MAFDPVSFIPFQSKHLHASIFTVFYINLFCFQHIRATSNETDYLALLKFKDSITDYPNEILSSWNGSNHFYSWTGITCGHKHKGVIELNLRGYHLGGTISPHIGNLSFLRNLSLTDNSFYGKIPPELGRLFRLKELSLGNNRLKGEIPWNLMSCTELRCLNLSMNGLTGKIPSQIGCQQLERFAIHNNNLTGKLPASMWNLSYLPNLDIAYSHLEGSIPEERADLKNLKILSAVSNHFLVLFPLTLQHVISHCHIISRKPVEYDPTSRKHVLHPPKSKIFLS
ncbi:LRR receptor-like serine/threonine-protein kinase EFR [Neltuma alba]|uniref:LRR receptor-like serine/threonine-protein kinase EFR n=1 Tax=Neltuma alba TaxID=207710 RepID=UPI0010A44423|nr:LRR receptor-like serine/threonine-protein kinase EFR [Prosopis alba]